MLLHALYACFCLSLLCKAQETPAWDATNYPNPTAGGFRQCNMLTQSQICDPDQILSVADRNRINHELRQLETRTRQDHAGTFCEKKGITAALAVARRVRGGTEEATKEMANMMKRTWTLDAQCQKSVVLVIITDDKKFWVARDYLFPVSGAEFTSIFQEQRALLQAKNYKDALLNMVQKTWEKTLSKVSVGGGGGGRGTGGGHSSGGRGTGGGSRQPQPEWKPQETPAWDATNYPNPTAGGFQQCNMLTQSQICDPDQILSEADRSRINHELQQLEARTRQDHAGTFCEKKGITGALAVARRVRGGTEEATKEMANMMKRTWSLDAQCQKSVVLVLITDDRKFWVARDDLVPVSGAEFASIFQEQRALLQAKNYKDALLNTVRKTWEKTLSKVSGGGRGGGRGTGEGDMSVGGVGGGRGTGGGDSSGGRGTGGGSRQPQPESKPSSPSIPIWV
jgi:hypothetical protein